MSEVSDPGEDGGGGEPPSSASTDIRQILFTGFDRGNKSRTPDIFRPAVKTSHTTICLLPLYTKELSLTHARLIRLASFL